MRGAKGNVADEDYEVGADKEDKQGSSDKPLSSQYRGVCWNRKNKRWQAAINSGGKYVYLGSFLSEYDAARAFDKAAVKLRGTRAKLNFAYSDYVDENGNLLEDPKMKNVMYKIEVMQGCNGGGGGGGGGGYSKHDSGSDHDGTHGPIPLLEDGAAAAAHRQLPVFAQTEGGPGKAGAVGNAGAGLNWHGVSRGLQLVLVNGNGGELGAFPPYPEGAAPVQALPLPAGPSGRGPTPAGPSRNRTPGPHAGQQQAALQMLQELSPYAGQGAAATVAAGGGGGGGPLAALGLSVNAVGEQAPPPARVQAVNAITQRSILRELKPSCQILAYVPVPSRYSSREEMCGVLFHDTESPGLIGSAAWTGSTLLMMGMYDTDRDARQAAIKCMQLYNAFCKEEWRVDFYNALTAMGGDQYIHGHPNNQHQNGGVKGQRDPTQHPQSSVAAAGGSSNNNHNANADGSGLAAGAPLPLPGAYGPRTSARGSTSSSLADLHPPPHGAGAANQESAPAPPYVRSSGGSAGVGGFGGGDNGPGRNSPSQPPASGGFGQQHQESGGVGPSGSGAVIPLAVTNPPAVLTELFHYMANFNSKSTGGDTGDDPTLAAHGGTGSGLGLGKRSAPGDCSAQQQGPSQQLQQRQQQRARQEDEAQRQQQQQHDAEEQRRDVKRTRLDVAAGGALEEFREAHNLPLAALVKQLEQAAAGR